MQQANVEIPRDYSVRVRSVRGCIELTQAALAKRIGVSFATVNRWENGQSRPTRLAWQQILDLEAEIATSEGGVEPAAPAEAPSTLDFPAKRSVRVAATKATRRTGDRDFSPPFAADQSREHEAAIHAAVQERVARLLSSSPAVIYSFEARGTFGPTFVSDNIKRVFGYDPRDYLENSDFWRERVHPDDLTRVEAEVSRTFGDGVNALEYRFRREDGSYCWVNDEQHLIRGEDGQPVEVVGSWSDVSAVKKAEAKKKAARARLSQLLASSPAVIYSFEATGDFRPTFVSQNIEDWLGYEPSDYLESPDFWRRCVHPDELAAVEAEFGQLFKKGRHTLEYRFLKKEGEYCWVRDELRLVYDKTGQPAEVVGSWSDITARKAAEDVVAQTRAQVEHLLASSPAVIYSFKATGDFGPTFVSRNIKDWLGYEPSDYLESPDFWRRCVHPDDLSAVEAEFGRLFKKGRHTLEYRFLKKDGEYCWVRDELRLVYDRSGQPAEVVGSWSDITARKAAEESVAAARAQVERLLASSPAVIYSFKATGDFGPTFVSRNIKDWLGYEPNDYLESPDFWRRCVHPDDLSAVEAEFGHLFKTGRHTLEYRFLKKNGDYCWVRDDLRLVYDKSGQPAEVVGSWSDITERKRAEEAVAAAQERVEHLLGSSPAVIYSFKASGDYAPTFISRNVKELLGYEPAEYLDSPDFWRSRVHPKDSERILGEYSRLFAEGHLNTEYRFRRKDGSYCWISDELQLLRNAAGEPLEVVGSWNDITARKQIGEALVAAQDRIGRLLLSAPAVIYSYKAAGDFAPTFVSQNIRDWLGYEPQEYLENPEFWWRCVHPDDHARVEAKSARLYKKGRNTVEYRFLRKDGTYCWVNDEQRLIRDDDGQPMEVAGSWSDISERKQAEEAVAAARERIEHLLASSPAVIYSFRATGDYAPTFISQNVKDLLGYDRDEYLNSPDFWKSRVHPQDSPRILRAYSRLFEEERLSSEYRFRKKDGSYCWVSDDLQVIRSAAGDPIEVVGAWSDITQRKQLGEALVAAQERLMHLLSCAPAVIYSYKATGDFAPTFVSQNIRDWLGYEPQEYLENPEFWWRCVHPDDRRTVEAKSSRLYKKGRHTIEYRFLKKDGSYCWVIDEQHLIRDKDGQPVEVVGSWSDVTAPKEAEIAFRRSEQRLTDAIATISEGFSLYDAEDKLVVCNKAYGELLYPGLGTPAPGMPYETLIRNAVKQGLVEEAKNREDAWIAERLSRHRQPGEPHVQRRADGRWIQVNERQTTEGGTVAVYTNITEIKRAEEELREAHRKAELANQIVSEQKRELEVLSTKLSKYLSPQVYSSIFSGKRNVEIASNRKKLTVFFSDIADFTATTDDLESEELTSLLNHYLTEMSKIALEHGATIDKYVGDAILAFFGDPETKGIKEDAVACVNMAVAMQRRMRELQSEWRDAGLEKPFELRIGISTGYCTVGNFGSEDRMDYTIIGGQVNLASRLQSNAEPGSILVSHETYALVKDTILADEQEPMHAKGFAKPVRNYRVLDQLEKSADQGRVIREEQDGLRLFLDLQKLQKATAVETLKSVLSRLEG